MGEKDAVNLVSYGGTALRWITAVLCLPLSWDSLTDPRNSVGSECIATT
jgi:hypothetical protein